MNPAINLEKHFIQVPTVAGSWLATTNAVDISLAELETPISDGRIGEGHATYR